MKLGLLAEVRGGGVRGGFRGPTCYWVSLLMLRKGLKTLKTTTQPSKKKLRNFGHCQTQF